jgi:hypothetical protein
MTNPPDTRQQQVALRRNRAARWVRRNYPAGTRVTSGVMEGTVTRHVPGLNAQGGYLVVEWANGQTGRIGPGEVRRAD